MKMSVVTCIVNCKIRNFLCLRKFHSRVPLTIVVGGGDVDTDTYWDNEKKAKRKDKTRNEIKRLKRGAEKV